MTCIQKEVEVRYDKDHHLPPIIRIPDKLWDEIKKVLPKEKPSKTVGRPIVPYRKLLDGTLYVLRTGCQWNVTYGIRFWFNISPTIPGMKSTRCFQKDMD